MRDFHVNGVLIVAFVCRKKDLTINCFVDWGEGMIIVKMICYKVNLHV